MNEVLFSDRAAIVAAQEANFAEMRELLAARHPYYRPLLHARNIASLADLPRLPVTSQEDFMQGPTPFVSTAFDFYRILELHRNMMRLRRVQTDDVIANLFPLTKHPHGAFIRTLHAAAAMNLPVVSALPGDPSPYFTLGNRTDEVV